MLKNIYLKSNLKIKVDWSVKQNLMKVRENPLSNTINIVSWSLIIVKRVL